MNQFPRKKDRRFHYAFTIAELLVLCLMFGVLAVIVMSCNGRKADDSAGSTNQKNTSLGEPVRTGISPDMIDSSQGTDEAKRFLHEHWNDLVLTCPGILSYAQELAWIGLEDMSDTIYSDNVRGVGIHISVIDSPRRIPLNFYSSGNHCRYVISPDGRRVLTAKLACASVCKESLLERSSDGYVFPVPR